MNINAVKGTHDIIGEEGEEYAYVEDAFRSIAEFYGYKEITVPVIEHTELFDRGTGEGSDVVRKEMYTFLDKGGRSLTLRPEFTAGVARSFIESKAYAGDLPFKVYYRGPLFRYERPQAGRYREFHSFGIEAIGADSPYLDAETVLLSATVLAYLGFKDITIKVNTLGDEEGRKAYREALKEYFGKHIDSMCADCHERLELNPLRILDCKVPSDQEIVKGAPKLEDYISDEADRRFYKTLSILADYGLEYEVDRGLVRGLDYYSGFVYEVHAKDEKGQKLGALLGGGHYDKLVESLGGPSLPGVGFGVGLERVVTALQGSESLEQAHAGLDAYVVPLSENEREYAFAVLTSIRNLGYRADMPFSGGKLGSFFKKAERMKAKTVILIGEEEAKNQTVSVKDQRTMEQVSVGIDDLEGLLDSLLGGEEAHCCCGDEGCGCEEHEEHEHCCCKEGHGHGHHHE